MNYTTFFTQAIEEQVAARKRAQAQVLEQHARIIGLLEPMLCGLDEAFTGCIYQGTAGGETFTGRLQPYQAISEEDSRAVFGLECFGFSAITIELTEEGIYLRNGIQVQDWSLSHFDESDVESMAYTIAQALAPQVKAKGPGDTTPGPALT